MKILVSLLAVALVAMGCSSTSSDPVSTTAADNSKAGAEVQKAMVVKELPIEFEFPNDCCGGELVTGIGIGRLVIKDDGKLPFIVKLDAIELSLTDESGREYTLRGRGPLQYVFTGRGEQQQVSMHLMNADGCSFTLKFVIKFQVNNSGDFVVEIFDIKTICTD